MANLFERATREKLRFGTSQGTLSVEELWDLPLSSKTGKANLDDIARAFHRQLKDQAEESFVEKPAKTSDSLELGFELVKHIIEVRLAENEAAANARKKQQLKQKIASVIAEKEDEGLRSKSLEELQAELANL